MYNIQRCFFICVVFLYATLSHFSLVIAEEIPLLPEGASFRASGYLKNETAYRFREPRSYTKIRNTLYLRSTYVANRWVELNFAGRAYYDLAYDLFDYDTISARPSREIDQPLAFIEGLPQEKDSNIAEIRELYVDIFGKKADLRLGKQFIIWGILTGVRVVDEINPMDFKELITPPLLEYRIPLWSAKLDIYQKYGTLQLIWIPDIRFNKPAPRGSEWELFQEVPGTKYPRTFTKKNSEFGFRYSTNFWDNELTFSYFYTWDDFPVLYRKVLVAGEGEIQEPEFFPRYERMHMLGGTFQRTVGGQILKAEGVYVKGKYFGLSAVDRDGDGYLDHQGVLQRDHIRVGVGLDFNILKAEVSPSITQWIILKYDNAILQDRIDTSVNLFVRKTFSKRSAAFELLGIFLLNLKEAYIKPKFSFRPTSQFEVAVGVDMFYGKKSQLGVIAIGGRPTELLLVAQSTQFIGNFNANDRVFAEFKYSF